MRSIILILFIFLFACCKPSIQKKYYLDENDLKHFAAYKYGDTIIFHSNLGSIDTMLISSFGGEDFRSSDTRSNRQDSLIGKSIAINFLPIENWIDTVPESDPMSNLVNYRKLIYAQKSQKTNKTHFLITYKDFISRIDTLPGKFHADTLILNGKSITNYYLVERQNPYFLKNKKNIITVYWTDKLGLTAYKDQEGETWTIENK